MSLSMGANDATHLDAVELIVVATGIGLVQRSVVNHVVTVDVNVVLSEVAAVVEWDLAGSFRELCFPDLGLLLIFGRLRAVNLFVLDRLVLHFGFASSLFGRRLLVVELGRVSFGCNGFGLALLGSGFRLSSIVLLVIFWLGLDGGLASALSGSWFLPLRLRIVELVFVNGLHFGFSPAIGFPGLLCRGRLRIGWRRLRSTLASCRRRHVW